MAVPIARAPNSALAGLMVATLVVCASAGAAMAMAPAPARAASVRVV